MMDLFEEWLSREEESEWVKLALTDASYKNATVNQAKNDKKGTIMQTNAQLATLGDRVISLCLADILYDSGDITEAKKAYEEDWYFVSVVARYYDLLPKIKVNDNADRLSSYDYQPKKNKNPLKYIATAVEAVIGAIYKETEDIPAIRTLVGSWMHLPGSEECVQTICENNGNPTKNK